MKKLLIIFSVLFALLLREECHGQGTVKYTAGISYGFGDPTYTPTGNVSKKYINLTTLRSSTYSGTTWVLDGRGIDVVSGCAAPAYTPGLGQSNIAINNCTLLQNGQGPELYVFDGTSWIFINEKNTAPTYTAGTGIDITGTVISNTGDLSNTNEIQNLSLSGQTLGISSGNTVALPVVAVAAGAGISVSNSSGTATVTNTAPDQVVSITGAGTNTVTGSYPNFTITGVGGGGVYTGGEGIVVDSPSIRIDTLDRLSFSTSPTLPGGIGTIRWNDTDGTIEVGMKGGNVTQQIGQEQLTLVKHADNSGLANGNVVYVVGSDGTNKTVRLARADAESTSANTFGVMTEAATGGNKAFCTTFGLVRDLNTSALTEGAMVWLSSATAGAMTTTRPTAPNHAVQIGFCIRSNATQGVIFVSVQNGYELDELHNVTITSPVNNQILQYNTAGSQWVNATLSAITGSGAAGQVSYWNGTSSQTGSNDFFYTAANGQLSLGTASPISVAKMQIELDATRSNFILRDANGNTVFNVRRDANASFGSQNAGFSCANGVSGSAVAGIYFRIGTPQNGATSDNGGLGQAFILARGSTATSGNTTFFSVNGDSQFAPTSGSRTFIGFSIAPSYNQTGTATGSITGLDYNPSVTSTTGRHYAALFRSGQVSVGTSSPSVAASLEVSSTTGGVLFPRMTATQRDAIASPPDGLVLYNTTAAKLQVRASSTWVDLH